MADDVESLSAQVGLNAGQVFFRQRFTQPLASRCAISSQEARASIPQIARDFHDFGIDMLQAYGLTETCGRASSTLLAKW